MRGNFFNEQIETMDRKKLEELQLKRLKRQVKRCYNNTSFYHEKFKNINLNPEDINKLSDIEKIPFTTKEELKEAQKKYIPYGNYTVNNEGWRELHPTTGTTGIPVHTVWSKKDIENIKNFTARFLWGFGVREGMVIHNAFSYGLWVAGLAVHYAADLLDCPIIPVGKESFQIQTKYLVNFLPEVIISTPTFCLDLIERLNIRKLYASDLSLKIGAFGGESGVEIEATRNKIEKALGIKAYDIFGMGEIAPTMAAECEAKDGLHWAEDHHLVEVIDPVTKKPCDDNEIGVLVITDLTKDVMPLLRYWTNDYARLTKEKCICGRTHARSIGGILGRHDDLIVYKGNKFYPIEIEQIIQEYPLTGDKFKIIVKENNNVVDRIKVVVEKELSNIDDLNIENKLINLFENTLNFRPEIEITDKGNIDLKYSNKGTVIRMEKI